MSFLLLTQLEEMVLKFIVNSSSSSFTELEKLLKDIFLDCYTIHRGTLSNILSKLAKKKLIVKQKQPHVDSTQSICRYVYIPTESAQELIEQYNLIHQAFDYSVTRYAKTKSSYPHDESRTPSAGG